jgi:hypothetical protein
MNMFKRYPNVFSSWIGKELYIGLSQSKDLEIILNRCLNKGHIYEYVLKWLHDTIVAAPGLRA